MQVQKRENNEKAKEFYINRTLTILLIDSFHHWKDCVFSNQESINSKCEELERRIVIKRVRDVLYALHGISVIIYHNIEAFAKSEKARKYKTDPSNPKFAEFVEAKVQRLLRISFDSLKQALELK